MVTLAVYARLFEFYHFDIQNTGQALCWSVYVSVYACLCVRQSVQVSVFGS